jgi:phage/plasmid-like protein (TIGR03299 family)
MAHGITGSDSVGIVGTRGWHGLGKQLPAGHTARDGFRILGIDWPMELAPVYAEVQRGVDEEGNPILRRIRLEGHRAHIRMDNDAPLGVVTDGYQQVTNGDLADLLDSLAGQDAASVLESAGSLFGGRRVFGCIRLPSIIRVGADIVETFVVASNGNGGFAGLNVYPTSIRPECNNMLRWSERDLGKGITFRHSGDMAEKIQQARVAMGLAQQEVRAFEKQVHALAGAQLSGGQVRQFMELAYDRTFGPLPDRTEQPEAFAKLSEKRAEVLARWMANLEDKRQQVAGIRGTAWQALNAVTQWHDWERGRMKADSEQRLHSNLFGQSNRDKQVALKAALSLV